MLSSIIFVITFVFGVLRFITLLKVFELSLSSLIGAISPFKLIEFWRYIDTLVFYFSLCYQVYFWASKFGVI